METGKGKDRPGHELTDRPRVVHKLELQAALEDVEFLKTFSNTAGAC